MKKGLCTRIRKSAQLAWVFETGGPGVWRMGFQPGAAGMAAGRAAMVADPRPSWAAPLSWEVTAQALGGSREALIRWGMVTDAISYRRICRVPQSLRTKKLAVWGSCFVSGEPSMNQPVRELCAERNHGKLGHEKYHKRLENIADNEVGKVR